MVQEYKITGKFKLEYFEPILWRIFFLCIIVCVSIISNGINVTVSFILPFFLILLGLGITPLYFLHSNYYEVNYRDTFICDYDRKEMTYQRADSAEVKFSSNQILGVLWYSSYPFKNGYGGKLLWDNYNYVRISLEGERQVIITSLLVPDIRFFIANMGIDERAIVKVPSLYSSIGREEA